VRNLPPGGAIPQADCAAGLRFRNLVMGLRCGQISGEGTAQSCNTRSQSAVDWLQWGDRSGHPR